MKRIAFISAALLTSLSYAADIQSVQFGASGNSFNVVFKNANTIPTAFIMDNPPGIVLDFRNTGSAVESKNVPINQNGVYSVDIIEAGNRTRAVINMSENKGYEIIPNGGDIIVRINQQAVSRLQEKARDQEKPQARSSNALNLGFAKTDAGNGAVTFSLKNPNAVVDVHSEGQHIIVDLPDYSPSKNELRRYDVRDYSALVKAIDVRRQGSGTRINLNMGSDGFEYITYQTGSSFTVEVFSPLTRNEDQAVQEALGFGTTKVYKGQPLSLNFQDIEVRSVIQIIAEFTKTNVIVSDSVNGNITLRLDNVPWDQALDIIMKTKGLDKRESNGVLYIAPAEELLRSETAALKGLREKRELTPSRSEMIEIRYAKAADLATIIENSRRVTGNNDNQVNLDEGVLSPKGRVTTDSRTNTLIVSDIPEKIEAVRQLVNELDVPVRQVLIDARLVLTQDNFSRDLGVRFGATFVGNVGNTLIAGTGTGTGANEMITGAIGNAATSGRYGPVTPPTNLGSRLGVDLAGAGGGSHYGLAILASDLLIDLELSALQTEGRVEVISSPRVVTADGAEAEVASGTRVPYITQDEGGNANVEFEDAELSLTVTPRIAPNNMVDMELDITNDSLGQLVSAGGDASYSIDTNSLKTNVLVDNGETVVLGGVYKQDQRDSVSKVPLLGDLPAVGNLFRNRSRNMSKNELLIFVTPRIIDKMLAEQDKFTNLRNQ